MMLAASAAEFVVLYLGLELMTLCSYVLVGITRDRPTSNEAAIKCFLLGSFASALLLYGIGLTYGVTGATEFVAIASAVSDRNLGQQPLLLVGVALVAAGLAFKIAAVPFHAWAPDAYQGASAPVAAFLSAGSKAAGLAALIRVGLVAFASEQRIWSAILLGLAVLSMIVGSLLAVSQTNLKRLLAYSSIAHAGYALLGLVPGTPDGASATMTYAFVYAFMTLGAFGIVTGLGQRGEELGGYHGLAAVAPVSRADVSVPAVVDRNSADGGVRRQVRRDPERCPGRLRRAGGPGRAVHRRVGFLLPAHRRPIAMHGGIAAPARTFPLGCRPPWWS